jgi:2-polyprenyl-3-methyl-5-hydroxy-6-metoxy-1,4-benzoquinol methylase
MDEIKNMPHRLPRARLVTDRTSFIQSFCRGKNVLHLGCVGTFQSIDKSYSLHQKVLEVAATVTGIDVDEKAIEYLRQKGITNLICADIQIPGALDRPEIAGPIDVIVAGELLEHLPNPGLCLENITKLMHRHKSVLLITVPNAFSFRNFFSVMLTNRELVLSDHRCYFSYTTIKALLEGCGLSIIDVCVYSNFRQGQHPLKRFAKKILNNTLFRYSPFLAEGIIVTARA